MMEIVKKGNNSEIGLKVAKSQKKCQKRVKRSQKVSKKSKKRVKKS